MIIRDATPGDAAAWQTLWAQYLAFYDVDLAAHVTAATWARLINPVSPVKARLALSDERVIGFAIHLHHPSTWAATEDCYLEDLFVAPDARGLGAGRALLDDLIALAAAKGWSRLYWHTNEDNTRARALYDSYVKSDGHIRYRLPLSGPREPHRASVNET
ncbi:GNAT family N-acetyltransferase [Tabrizicola sp.]|uniref:GNAT family N-acetyltransferase n=1 Tax=Tabrizicola sp. TaxID=2005166 RepID=UPI00286A3A50|nr:GNAT family N-acetyltransferase [Tabrizicola sp.]